MKLPLIINQTNKHFFVFLSLMLYFILYTTTNHFPLNAPVFLPMTYIDNAMPFIPASILIYLSDYVLPIAAFYVLKNRHDENRFMYTFVCSMIFCTIFFIIFPTTYPRNDYPLTGNENSIIVFLVDFIRNADTPNNCFPSLHVSSSFIAAFAVYHSRKDLSVIFMTWAVLIAVSTLSTKQHYVSDVIAGFLTGWVFHWYFFKKALYKEVISATLKSR